MALTATATERVQKDIMRFLQVAFGGLKFVFSSGFVVWIWAATT
jgi:hypothetical protein